MPPQWRRQDFKEGRAYKMYTHVECENFVTMPTHYVDNASSSCAHVHINIFYVWGIAVVV